jgi:zinc transport system ATP-binding protein
MDSAAGDRNVLISVRNVSFRYDGQPVLLDVSLDIRAGNFLALLGPNGSGKTTLLKIILGLLKPQSGGVILMGRTLAEFKEWSRIGYVPQKATHIDPFFPASVREVVAMALPPGRPKPEEGLPRRRRDNEVERALEFVGMSEFGARRIGSLSGGQQQRVFIARAIVTRPRVLLLDEPTTGVDVENQERFYDILAALNDREGITIVQVTHDIGIVDRHINQVACLNQRLTYHGSHEEFCRSQAFRDMIAGGNHLVAHRH